MTTTRHLLVATCLAGMLVYVRLLLQFVCPLITFLALAMQLLRSCADHPKEAVAVGGCAWLCLVVPGCAWLCLVV